MGKLMTGVFIGVFAGAFAYELIRQTALSEKACRKLKDGYKSAKKAFLEGYQSVSDDEESSTEERNA